jgi:hypothetical protein
MCDRPVSIPAQTVWLWSHILEICTGPLLGVPRAGHQQLMKSLTRHEILLIETVQAHLANLAGLSVYDASEGTLRVLTGALRALLVEEMLQRAWNVSGLRGPITFNTYCINCSTGGDDVIAYCGGGDIIPNIPFSVGRNATVSQSP